MSDRKEENFDFESDLDDELFSGTEKKDSKGESHADDLDFLDEEDEGGAPEDAAEKPAAEGDEHLDEGEFSDIGGIQAHAEQDFDKDMFDPSSLDMNDNVDMEAPVPESSAPQGIQGLIQKVKEGWPYYVGAGCAVVFGIYLVSVILSGTTSEQAKSKQAAATAHTKAPNTKSFGLTLQDTSQFQGTLDTQKKDTEVINNTLANLPVAQDDAAGTVTMDKQDMAKLLQGFSQVVNTSVEKISTGMNKNLKEQSAGTNVDEMKRMRKSIEMLIERIDQYEQKLVKLDGSLVQLSTQLNLLVAQKTAQTDSLTLRAVVPGRAWLVDSQGRTYTVAEGDLVGSFGKIIQIDATAGRVVTSSGYVFN